MKRNLTSKDFQELLHRYRQRQTTAAEDKVIQEWIDAYGEDQPMVNLADHKKLELQERIWASIKVESGKEKAEKIRFISSHSFMLKVAATLLIGVAVAIFLVLNKRAELTDKPIAETASGWKEVRNTTAKTMKIDLSDGSAVLLSPGGILTTALANARNQRVVRLQGEAFFDVAHDESRPFIVYSQDIVTRVLGTKFIVRAPGKGQKVSVVVNSGKVAVSNPNKKSEVILMPDQKVVYDPVSESFAQNAIIKKDDAKQKRNVVMTFDEEPVSNILDLLEEKYTVEIDYDKELLQNCMVTTAFQDEGLYERLTITAKIIDASYTIENGKVIFKSTGCN